MNPQTFPARETAAGRAGGATAFDHAIIMMRDQIDALAPRFEQQGFHLSEKAMHNLGSCNRLIVLDSAYIELLGWPPGAPPKRNEIVNSPLGLEALVFRSHDAQATRDRLQQAGFAVRPIQPLSRPAEIDGKTVEVAFNTLHFAEQPIAGFRLYFCQHLTPQSVWTPALTRHPNGARRLHRIEARAAGAQAAAQCLARVTGARAEPAEGGWDVPLANLRIHVAQDAQAVTPRLHALTIENQGGERYALDTGLE
jgi:hypothetical protein